MGTFLFLLLFFFVLLPLGRAAWTAWRQWRIIKDHMRQARDMQDAFYRAQQQAQQSRRQPDEPHAGSRNKKKISKDVGEYVAFEEVRSFASASADAAEPPAAGPAAEQVEDADWEEIK